MFPGVMVCLPPYWFAQVQPAFERKGWEVIGWGARAVVLTHPERAGVLRMSPDYSMFHAFCNHASQVPSQWLPKIYKQTISMGILHTWMERLDPVNVEDSENDAFWLVADCLARLACAARDGRPMGCNYNDPMTQAAVGLGCEALRISCKLDFSYAHFMHRPGDPEDVPVVIDVFGSEGSGTGHMTVLH